MEFIPLNGRILIDMVYEDEVRPSGIVIPESAREKPMYARVVCVGEGYYLDDGTFIKTALKQGDLIILGKYAGSEVILNGRKLIVAMEQDVFGKVVNAD